MNYISIFKETIFGILENTWDQYHSLIEVKKNPDIMDNYRIEKIIKAYKEQSENNLLFNKQFEIWQTHELSTQQNEQIQELLEGVNGLKEITKKSECC